jgi:GAF domain-containing protein
MTSTSQNGGTSHSERPRSFDFAETVLSLHEAADVHETVERIVESTCSAIGCDDAGVILTHSRRHLETLAATSDAARRAHEIQLELDEGPCLDAIEHVEAIFHVPDTAIEPRWPRWGKAVVELGYRSTLSVPLATRTRRFGSLNVYSRLTNAFDEDDMAVVALLARHASASLAATQNIEGLRKAVDARKLIGVAIGLLMERYGLDADRAFDVLRRLSQAENVKLREIARQVVERRGLPND